MKVQGLLFQMGSLADFRQKKIRFYISHEIVTSVLYMQAH